METTAGRRNATKKYVLIWFTENLNPEIRKYCANKLRTITVLNDDVRKNVLWFAKKRFGSVFQGLLRGKRATPPPGFTTANA
jgi:hypothetical protein